MNKKEKSMKRTLICGLFLFLAGCAMGPNYQKPQALVPATYKSNAPWKEAAPNAQLSKGNWWEIYADQELNRLEGQALEANQSLQSAYARMSQVFAAAGISRSERMPRLDLNASALRQRSAADLSVGGTSQIGNQFNLPLNLGYEIDLWGRVKRSIEATDAEVEGASADYQNLLLILQTDLARSYFSLRAVDAELDLLNRTAVLREQALKLVQSKFSHGQVGQLDLARAEAELASTRAEEIGLQKSRGELENRIALLVGASPSSFRLAPRLEESTLPQLQAGLPSSLLERRPDVAAAERRMAAASARIGVAKTAFFPAISLTGSAGFGSSEIGDLFNWDNRTWGLGPAISLPIFSGGRNSANLDRARSAYDEAVADYRQQVLVAFAEVEDGLNGLEVLARQRASLQEATDASTRAWQISEKRYRAGLVSYLEVVDSQRSALQAQRQMVRNRNLQLETSVLLIKALGGGWSEAG